MKVLKKIIIIKLILLVSVAGCTHGYRDWEVKVVNKLSDSIYVAVRFCGNDKIEYCRYDLGPMQPEEMASARRQDVWGESSPKAHEEIYKIFVFSEDKTPLIILKGKEMDEYVVFIGKDESGNYLFYFEVKEEDIGTYMGVDLYKGIDFGENEYIGKCIE